MGCVCCSLSSFVSIVLDALERVSLCTVCAMLTCCLMITIITVMVLGIGIGYHYCFVQNSVEAMAKAAEAAGALRTGSGPGRSGPPQVMRSVDKAVKRGFAHRISRREILNPDSNNTINFNSTANITSANHF
ncbi:unnamed protein product [Danaus chrysippus]|uniref:(African queen) hypothetical protein n=1 Tax=Danaus chrysippus TaxID=151541 RepID=A0A8J2VZX8_9NEOP|nr:unnamed protein product [Danaus chrysippus]